MSATGDVAWPAHFPPKATLHVLSDCDVGTTDHFLPLKDLRKKHVELAREKPTRTGVTHMRVSAANLKKLELQNGANNSQAATRDKTLQSLKLSILNSEVVPTDCDHLVRLHYESTKLIDSFDESIDMEERIKSLVVDHKGSNRLVLSVMEKFGSEALIRLSSWKHSRTVFNKPANLAIITEEDNKKKSTFEKVLLNNIEPAVLIPKLEQNGKERLWKLACFITNSPNEFKLDGLPKLLAWAEHVKQELAKTGVDCFSCDAICGSRAHSKATCALEACPCKASSPRSAAAFNKLISSITPLQPSAAAATQMKRTSSGRSKLSHLEQQISERQAFCTRDGETFYLVTASSNCIITRKILPPTKKNPKRQTKLVLKSLSFTGSVSSIPAAAVPTLGAQYNKAIAVLGKRTAGASAHPPSKRTQD